MIARIWRGRTPAAQAETYHAYLLATGVGDYQSTPGNRGVQMLRRVDGDEAEFLLITLWDSLDDVRAFAGDAVEKAVYYPQDKDYLLEFEPTVRHYEVLSTEQAASGTP